MREGRLSSSNSIPMIVFHLFSHNRSLIHEAEGKAEQAEDLEVWDNEDVEFLPHFMEVWSIIPPYFSSNYPNISVY